MGPTKMIAQLGLGHVGLAIFSGVALADATAPSKTDKSAIEKIVREYLLENPEVIDEAIQLLRARRQAEEENQAKEALSQNGDA